MTGVRGIDVGLSARRRSAAERYVAALDAFDAAARVVRESPPPWFRPILYIDHARRSEQAHRALRQSDSDAQMAGAALAHSCAGAGHRWGLLSGGGEGFDLRNLEWALGVVGRSDPACRDVADALPLVRALVELGRDTGEFWRLELIVEGLTSQYPLLRDFLSTERRQAPRSVQDLDRRTLLITLSVTEREADWDAAEARIVLHDIVCTPRGAGIGTAALDELCRYADRRSLPIVATFVPNRDLDDAGVTRLAAWYHRFGFDQDGRPPREWTPVGQMRRPVRPACSMFPGHRNSDM